MNPTFDHPTSRWLRLIVVVLAVVAVVRIGFAFYTRTTTGTLRVTTREPNAIVSISQQNKQALFLGKGTVSVRLKPGNYLVSATLAGDTSTATIHIDGGKTTSKSINPVHTAEPLSPSVETGFVNFDVLVNSGLGAEQRDSLERAFSEFKSTAQLVKVDPASVESLPHDEGTDIYEKRFIVFVDSVQYSALIEHSLFGPDVLLRLTDSTGRQIFSNEVVGD